MIPIQNGGKPSPTSGTPRIDVVRDAGRARLAAISGERDGDQHREQRAEADQPERDRQPLDARAGPRRTP